MLEYNNGVVPKVMTATLNLVVSTLRHGSGTVNSTTVMQAYWTASSDRSI